MDPHFGALFNQIQTKTVHRVLSPIANRVSQLVLFNEAVEIAGNGIGDGNIRGDGASTKGFVDQSISISISSDLPAFTRDISAALVELTGAALEGHDPRDYLPASASADENGEEVKYVSMASACDELMAAGDDLAAAASVVALSASYNGGSGRGKVAVFLSSRARQERARLVEAAKRVLRQTLCVLLVADHQEVKRLVGALEKSSELFVRLIDARTLKELVPRFKGFTDHMLRVADVVESRARELTSAKRSEALAASLMALQKTPHTLCGAMQTFIKYPDNVQARLSRDYASSSFLDAVDEMKNLLVSEDVDEELEGGGSFQKNVDDALMALLPKNRLELNSDFDALTEAVIRHSMTVLHLTTDEVHKSSLVATSDRLLRLKNRVADYCNNVLDNPSFQQLHRDFDHLCEKLSDDFKDLESVVNVAVLRLLVETSMETHEPLDRLIKAAMMMYSPSEELREAEKENPRKNSTAGKTTSGKNLGDADFEEYVEDFCAHTETLATVASLAGASSSDTRRVFLLLSSVRRLEAMDPEVVPAVEALRHDADDDAALHHLRMLKLEWKDTLESISSLLDEMMDARAFFETSFAAMKDRIAVLRAAFSARDTPRVLRTSRALGAMGRHVARVGRLVTNRCADPMFRNGLMAYVAQLEKACDDLKKSTRKATSTARLKRAVDVGKDAALEEGSNFACGRDQAMKKAYQVVNCAHKVLIGLNAENHPDMMSPLRNVARGGDGETGKKKPRKLSIKSPRQNDEDEDEELSEKKLDFSIAKIFEKTSIEKLEKEGSSRQSNLVDSQDSLRRHPYLTSRPTDDAADTVGSSSLGRALVRASISGDTNKMSVLCQRVTAWTNHLTEVADDICPHVTSYSAREDLDALARSLTDLMPGLLDKVKKVHRGEINKLEESHRSGGDWDKMAIKLKKTLDRELKFWDAALNGLKKVVVVVSTGNDIDGQGGSSSSASRIEAEASKIKDIGQSWIQVVNMCLSGVIADKYSPQRRRRNPSSESFAGGRASSSNNKEVLRRDLRQHLKSLPRLTQQLTAAASAEISTNDGSRRPSAAAADGFGFSSCCREWTAGFFVMSKRVDEALWNEMEQLSELESAVLNGDFEKSNACLARLREWTGKYERMIFAIMEEQEENGPLAADDRPLSPRKAKAGDLTKIALLGKEIKLLSAALNDVVKTVVAGRNKGLSDNDDDDNHDEEMAESRLRSMAPLIQKVAILLRAMAAKTAALAAELDAIVEDATPPIDDLLGIVFALLGRGLGVSTDASLSSLKRDFDNRADHFVEKTIRAKRKTREVFESLIAVGQHENAHRIAMALETFSDVTQHFTSFLTTLSDSTSHADDATAAFKNAIDSRGEAEMLRREWACHARALLRTLESSPGVTDRSFDEIRDLILGSKSHSRRSSSAANSLQSSISSADDVNFVMHSGDGGTSVAGHRRSPTHKSHTSHHPPSPPSPPMTSQFATPASSMRSRQQTPHERRQLKSLTPLMLSAKFSALSTATAVDRSGVVTSTPIHLPSEACEIPLCASPSLNAAAPLGGTPIKRKIPQNRWNKEASEKPPMVDDALKPRTKNSDEGLLKSTSDVGVQKDFLFDEGPSGGMGSKTAKEIARSISSRAYSSPPYSSFSAQLRRGEAVEVEAAAAAAEENPEEEVEVEIFFDDDRASSPSFPPPPPLCAITMTPNSTRKIADAAFFLQRETEKYGVDATKENVVMKSANAMSLRMRDIADFFHLSRRLQSSRPASSSGGSEGRSNRHSAAEDDDEDSEEPVIRSKEDLISAARAISADGEVVVRFAKTIADLCADRATAKDLLYYANQIPTLSTQLTILASVKAASSLASEKSHASDAVIVKNIQNLTQAVARTLRAAEGACMQGLPRSASPTPSARDGDSPSIASSSLPLPASTLSAPGSGNDAAMTEEAVALSMTWRRHLLAHRQSEASSSVLDDLGLRRIDTSKIAPKLVELLTI